MLNAGDIFISLVIGLALPLALIDGFRGMGGALPDQKPGLHLETRFGIWLWAVAAGPGLLLEKVTAGWRSGELEGADLVSGALIVIGWATIHGYIALSAIALVLPV